MCVCVLNMHLWTCVSLWVCMWFSHIDTCIIILNCLWAFDPHQCTSKYTHMYTECIKAINESMWCPWEEWSSIILISKRQVLPLLYRGKCPFASMVLQKTQFLCPDDVAFYNYITDAAMKTSMRKHLHLTHRCSKTTAHPRWRPPRWASTTSPMTIWGPSCPKWSRSWRSMRMSAWKRYGHGV